MQPNLPQEPRENTTFPAKLLSSLNSNIIRKVTQAIVVFIVLLAAWQFSQFVDFLRSGGVGFAPSRPPVVEGFLPIAAIVAFKGWLYNGVIDRLHPAGLMIFIATITTAWLFRRALCSWICPIGTLSEYLSELGRKIFGKNLKVPQIVDYLLLGVKYVIFFWIAQMLLLMPGQEAVAFMQIPYYTITDVKMFDFFMEAGFKTFAVIGILIVLSTLIKSFWCRYLCPYGAMLGILGLFSPILLTRDKASCINCNRCNQACPSNVEVATKAYVVTPECTGCTSCITACPKPDTLKFKLLGFLPINTMVYTFAFLIIFFGIIWWAKLNGYWETSITIQEYLMFDSMFREL